MTIDTKRIAEVIRFGGKFALNANINTPGTIRVGDPSTSDERPASTHTLLCQVGSSSGT